MYIEKKRIGGEEYSYLKVSVRYGDKVRTKTVAYLGKDVPKGQLAKRFSKYKSKAEAIKNKAVQELKSEFEEKEPSLSPSQIAKMGELKSEFGRKLRLEESIRQDMFNDFVTLYAYNTNAIEGNTFSLRDTDLLLNKGITPQGKTLREINDHLNAKEAFEFVLKKRPKINRMTIIRIHSILMKNIDLRVGHYRTHNVRVFGARFHTSPAEYVKIDMAILLRWYRRNKRLHPLVSASVFHHKFEKIHPFYDGNGRTGRLLLNLILLQNNLPPIVVPDAQRKRYYNALASADETALDKNQPEHREIVNFCYFCLLKTFNTVFGRWG